MIRRNLARRRRFTAAEAGRPAGVAVTLFEKRDKPHVLIIKRSYAGRNAGQWALPSGRADDTEDAEQAALREFGEEAGIVAGRHDVVGLLDDLVTASGFVITPVVVVIDRPVRPVRDPHEVHSLHPIPLSRLLAPGVPRLQAQPSGEPLLQMPLRHDMIVHAPTGVILWQFREVALLGREVGTADLTQPEWTRT